MLAAPPPRVQLSCPRAGGSGYDPGSVLYPENEDPEGRRGPQLPVHWSSLLPARPAEELGGTRDQSGESLVGACTVLTRTHGAILRILQMRQMLACLHLNLALHTVKSAQATFHFLAEEGVPSRETSRTRGERPQREGALAVFSPSRLPTLCTGAPRRSPPPSPGLPWPELRHEDRGCPTESVLGTQGPDQQARTLTSACGPRPPGDPTHTRQPEPPLFRPEEGPGDTRAHPTGRRQAAPQKGAPPRSRSGPIRGHVQPLATREASYCARRAQS